MRLPTVLQSRDNQNISQPFVFPPSQSWDGNDGNWSVTCPPRSFFSSHSESILTVNRSTFTIHVGTPAQGFRILPATNGNEIWVPLPQGCSSTDGTNCGDHRGVGTFNGSPSNGFQTNQSSTWSAIGIFDLIGEKGLNYTGNGQYGYDNVGPGSSISSTSGSSSLDLPQQVVAGIATNEFYLGVLGLGPKPANFTSSNDPTKSYMRTLADQNLIPSLSFGYTAGARYRLKSVFGSLTLGGYDASRFTPNNLNFTFGPDDSRSLLVGVQSITASNTIIGAITPLSSGILSLVDSGTPHIWLPTAACTVFERAFGLTYDPHTDLYLVNSSTHAQLTQLNPTVTFTLGNEISGGDTINITLPYGSFDLQASHPIYPNATAYFPLRRAANESQYTLGRTFFQEAYITVDYTRSQFSVRQAVFQDPMPAQQIKAITSFATTRVGVPQYPSSRMSIGTILATTFSILTLTIIIITLIIRQRRRDRRIKALEKERETSLLKTPSHSLSQSSDTRHLNAAATDLLTSLKPELPNDTVPPVQQLEGKEVPLGVKDVGSNGKQELRAEPVEREIGGGEVFEMAGGEGWVREMPEVGQEKRLNIPGGFQKEKIVL